MDLLLLMPWPFHFLRVRNILSRLKLNKIFHPQWPQNELIVVIYRYYSQLIAMLKEFYNSKCRALASLLTSEKCGLNLLSFNRKTVHHCNMCTQLRFHPNFHEEVLHFCCPLHIILCVRRALITHRQVTIWAPSTGSGGPKLVIADGGWLCGSTCSIRTIN